jgi:hypothetical protein
LPGQKSALDQISEAPMDFLEGVSRAALVEADIRPGDMLRLTP